MGIRLSTNVNSISVGRRLGQAHNQRNQTLEKLSSGSRIVRSADDSAGLSISEKLKAGVRSYQMAARNSNDGISVIQTAEGGIQEVQNVLLRLRELSVQAASDTVGDVERQYTNQEFQALKGEIARIANNVQFNGAKLLNGQGPEMEFQVGIDGGKQSNRYNYSGKVTDVTPGALGLAGIALTSKESARENLHNLDSAIERLGLYRSHLGAVQAALAANVQVMGTHKVNSADANSRIRDADMAEWTAKEVQQEIIADAGNSALVQANNLPKQALMLLSNG